MKANKANKITVVGVGNELLKDEGVGVHVARALQEAPPPGNVELEIIDGGTLPDVVLSLEEVNKLIVVDTVQAGGEPGAIYRFHSEDLKLGNRNFTSLHEISLLENLWLMDKFGKKPDDIVIIGVEPEDLNWGLELSEKIQQRVPQIIKVVLEEVGSGYAGNPEKGE